MIRQCSSQMPFGAKGRNKPNPTQVFEYKVTARFRGIQVLSLCCKQIIGPEVTHVLGIGLRG